MVVFNCNRCNDGVGYLKNRLNIQELSTDNERNLFHHSAKHDFYLKLGQQALDDRVSFDMYTASVTAVESIDLASMSKVVQFTGGDLVYYSKFNAQKHGEKLYYDLFRNLTKTYGADVSIKARCSTGLTVTDYFGSFGFKEAVDFKLSSIDADKSFCFSLRNDSKFTEG